MLNIKKIAFQLLLLALLLAFLLSGCRRKEDEAVTPRKTLAPVQNTSQQTGLFLIEPIPLQRVEVASEALAVWRQYSKQKPTLLLFSNDPMLIPVPEVLRSDVDNVITMASQVEIAQVSSRHTPSLVMLPSMTVDAALRSGWFSQLVWALPLRDPDAELSVVALRQQFLEKGLADEQERASLVLLDKQVSGVLRETPLVVAPLPNLPQLTGPVIVHFDQSYFQQMYKNEIATPLIPLVINTLSTLREKKIPLLAVTFSYGNLEERIALDVRFIGEIVERLVAHPENFDQPMPANWKRMGDSLYLANFFKKDEVRELALAMNAEEPDAAWVKFALFRSAAANKQGSDALSFLAEAVKLDNVYAMEYLNLSEMAYDKGRPDEALRMLSLAANVFPESVQIKLKMAHLATDMGENETALHLVTQLQQLEWSPVYYPDMPKYLLDFTSFLKAQGQG